MVTLLYLAWRMVERSKHSGWMELLAGELTREFADVVASSLRRDVQDLFLADIRSLEFGSYPAKLGPW
jgi:hypothetical protein